MCSAVCAAASNWISVVWSLVSLLSSFLCCWISFYFLLLLNTFPDFAAFLKKKKKKKKLLTNKPSGDFYCEEFIGNGMCFILTTPQNKDLSSKDTFRRVDMFPAMLGCHAESSWVKHMGSGKAPWNLWGLAHESGVYISTEVSRQVS